MMKRAHKALFDRALPFRPKVERDRKKYQRQPKHKGAANE